MNSVNLDDSGLINVRMENHLLGNTALKTPAKVVSWMGAIQAQNYAMAKWAVGVRMTVPSLRTVEDALVKGEILRTHVLRPTWHLVAAEDIRWMLQLSGRNVKRITLRRDKALEIDEEVYKKSNQIIRKTLEDGYHRTRTELEQELSRGGVAVSASRMVHFMLRAEIEGIVCSGIDRGKKQTYALLSERAPQSRQVPHDEALSRLARRYFRSHSPASAEDFVWWSGLPLAEGRRAVYNIHSELISVRLGGRPLFVHEDCGGESEASDAFHYLPGFDEYLVAYSDRSFTLNPDYHSQAVTTNGVFYPFVVDRGRVIGIWRRDMRIHCELVRPTYFEPGTMSREDEARAWAARERFARFLKN
jgi:hypothetical protein